MATYNETFLCTALPESITGTKLRVAVLISPRLGSTDNTPATLDNWPDVRDWPTIRPTWQLTLTQGNTTVTLNATEVSGPYDGANWAQMFPPTMPNTPYQANDRSTTPIFSYPMAKVRDAVRELHLAALTSSRTDFPTVAALQDMPHFADLKQATDPGFVNEAIHAQGTSPVPDASASTAQAIAVADGIQGVRPGSTPPPDRSPTVTKVDPPGADRFNGSGLDVTITGTNFMTPLTVHFTNQGGQHEVKDGVDIRVPDANTIKCKTPTFPDFTYTDVTVETPFGTSAVTPFTSFHYDGLR